MKRLLLIMLAIGCSTQLYAQKETIKDSPQDSVKTFAYVERMPMAPYNVNEYLSENLIYPKEAEKKGLGGKVNVRFVVTSDGSIKYVVPFAKDVDERLVNEAVRVVKGMPDWEPGRQNGKPVNVYFTIPIKFTPANESDEGENDSKN